jgi:hypothetical protein
MMFLAVALNHSFIHIQEPTIVGFELLAIRNIDIFNPIVKWVVHYARDNVPLCSSLQISLTIFSTLLGLIIRNFNKSGGTHGISFYNYHSATALGEPSAQ